MSKTWAIIGGGNGGQTMAAQLSILGQNVRLYDVVQKTVDEINAIGGIRVHHAVEGFGKLEFATTDMGKVMDGADVVVVILPSIYHKSITEKMVPHLKDGMVILLHPESSAGAIAFRKVMQDMNCTADVVVGAASTLLYSTRINQNGDVYVFGLKSDVPMAALPAKDNDRLEQAISTVIPAFRIVKNTLYTSLGNLNAMMHPAPMLLNTGRIEADPFIPFGYYHEGVTPSIGKYVEVMDAERIAVAKELGFSLRDVRSDYVAMYNCGTPDMTLSELVKNNEGYTGIMCSNTLSTRYLLEDIPYSLEPIRAIARCAGMPTPCIDAIITLARTILGDQMDEGRTAEALGIAHMDKEALLAFIEG